ncbi:HAD-like protein [Aspergillus indologenus CBS 114.80]|uniref:HAD-like protein n=1 Tax=Aspergillus indologenus CBS 114.80 TaxID=1450541 RepID=A0A2V5JG43_9EURO|nr:HAD-like protein [Aspergillus indologenus CBS 114.80]
MTINNETTPSNPTIFVDLGGTFVHAPADYALKTGDTTVPLGRVLSSSIWMEYEVGKLTEQECFTQAADLFGCDAKDLEAVVLELRATLAYDLRMLSVFKTLKQTPGVKVVLITNISEGEYRALRERWDEAFWSTFDHVFPSWEVGVRKPSLRFYRHVLRATRSSPHRSLVVDDRPENVLAAMSLGMRGQVGTNGISRVLGNFVGDPVARGLAFLRQHAGKLYSTTEDGDSIEENYAQLLVLEAFNDRTLVDLQRPPGLWNFFSGRPKYTSQKYPDDFDTTSLALVAMDYEPEAAHPILDEMLEHVNEDGLVPIYFDKSRPRVDAIIALNTLVAFGKYGRGNELSETLHWIEQILLHRAYIHGTRYYPSPEWFLYYMSRLLTHSRDPVLKERLEAPLKSRLVERIGAAGDAFCLGMRLLACHSLGIQNHPDTERLASMQQEDGGWEPSAMYIFPTDKKTVGNRGTTTALAVKALQGAQ